MSDRGILRRQTAWGQARCDHGVDRNVQIEPLWKLQPGLDAVDELLSRCRVTLFDGGAGQRRWRGAGGVRSGDGQRPPPRRPVAVDLSDHQLAGAGGPHLPLEGAVGGDLELAVVERSLAGGHVVVGVFAAEQLETEVRCAAADPGDQVVVVWLYPAAEVKGVRVV